MSGDEPAPAVDAFYLPGLSGRSYRVLGDRDDVRAVEMPLDGGRVAYDLFVPTDCLDMDFLRTYHPGVAAKGTLRPHTGQWAYTRVGRAAFEGLRIGLVRKYPDADRAYLD